jgi:hypothetical protein
VQLAEPGTWPLWQNPGNINSDSSDAVGSRGAGPSPKERYIAVAFFSTSSICALLGLAGKVYLS